MSYPSLFPNGSPEGPVFLGGWDRVLIGGDPLPGRVEVVRGGIEVRRDKPKPTGKNGGRQSTYHGSDPEDVEIEVHCWLDKHFSYMDAFLKKHGPPTNGDAPRPTSIDAAALRHLPIRYVAIVKVSQWADSPKVTRGKMLRLVLDAFTSANTKKTVTAQPKPKRKIANAVTDNPQSKNPDPSTLQSVAEPPNFSPG